MTQVCDAVYENGVFKPIGKPRDVKEGQRVNIVVDETAHNAKLTDARAWIEKVQAAAAEMFAEMTPEEIDEMERVMLDRSHFFTASVPNE